MSTSIVGKSHSRARLDKVVEDQKALSLFLDNSAMR